MNTTTGRQKAVAASPGRQDYDTWPEDEGEPIPSDGEGAAVTFFLIVDQDTRPGNPAGIYRRVTNPDGEITGERVFRRNLAWADVTGQYPAGYPAGGTTGRDLFEITPGQALSTLAGMQLTAARADDPPPGPDTGPETKPTVADPHRHP